MSRRFLPEKDNLEAPVLLCRAVKHMNAHVVVCHGMEGAERDMFRLREAHDSKNATRAGSPFQTNEGFYWPDS